MAILIKRYANRKLYNTDTSRYITLKGIAQLLEEGHEVRVMDNETGEDITQIALSQILVDNERAKEDPSETLLSQILARGGDALYGAIRKSVDEASDGLGDFQVRLRRLVNQSESLTRAGRGFARERSGSAGSAPNAQPGSDEDGRSASTSDRGPAPTSSPQTLEIVVRKAVSEALDARELPHRKDIENLSRSLERVAIAVERLEAAYRSNDADESVATTDIEATDDVSDDVSDDISDDPSGRVYDGDPAA